MHPEDFVQRVNFCRWFLHHCVDEPDIPWQKVLQISSTATFGLIKSCTLCTPMTFSNATVSTCGLDFWMDVLLGHTFFHLISLVMHFLEHTLHGLLEDVPLHVRQNMWFDYDGTSPHFTHAVWGRVDRRFGQTWIGHGGLIAWPACSPDLTPLNYSLWGHMKSLVY